MLDLPGHPTLDKLGLIGTCSRLPVRVNAARLQAEVAALPESSWAGTGGRVGVHRAAQAIFLRGFAPAEGEKPIEDRELLGAMPYVREIITRLIPAPAQRCLLARLPPAGRITGAYRPRALFRQDHPHSCAGRHQCRRLDVLRRARFPHAARAKCGR